MFLRPTLRREAQSTSALEGTFAPLEQVLASDATEISGRSKELQEVLNYVEAATLAYDAIGEGRPLNVGLLETVHSILVRGTDADTDQAGKIRESQVAIGSPTGAIEDARFVPMPAGVALNVAVQDLTRWVNDSGAARDPIVAAAMAHYQFETLHPFTDGNGRIGRLMVVLQFMTDRLVTEPLISVSPWFEARRTTYQEHLAEVSATGDWDLWITFFAEGVAASADDVAQRVTRMLAVQAQYVQILQEAGARGVIRDIVDALIGDQVINVSMMSDRFGRTPQAVSPALQRLVELGILSGPYATTVVSTLRTTSFSLSPLLQGVSLHEMRPFVVTLRRIRRLSDLATHWRQPVSEPIPAGNPTETSDDRGRLHQCVESAPRRSSAPSGG